MPAPPRLRTAACLNVPFSLEFCLFRQSCKSISNMMADREQWHNLASASSTSSTPNSADSLGYLLSPSRMNLPTRKRSHSKHLDGTLGPVEDNKSRRTSPSPFLNGPGTPSTISSGYGYGYPLMLGDGYFDLTLFVYKFTIPSAIPFPWHTTLYTI